MDFKSTLQKLDTLYSYHIGVSTAIAEKYITPQSDRRVICTLNNSLSFQCALMHMGDGSYFISVNKKIRDKLKLTPGTEVSVHLEKDESEYGLSMPEEFMETLNKDEEGSQIFHSITPGKQRTLIYIAGSVKDTQKRINRAIAIVTHLKNTNGKINFKQLYEAMKLN